ncbi:tyrosine-type recombinase/integrase [Sphingomonas dokdonensis]|uniref:Phage integrase family protein n=1 Tax=Sphingomonas dokdonensis TaxID=344880 RepID=A0A245ZHN6_9SPHN|nr:integrase family protein [Sphingomonas dokdonensis]OWK29247.1 phage integrase family protein [Sphingomonas dokdonensis]
MPQLKLTKTNIDRVAKPGGKSDVLYWDKDAKGFGLRVTPTGLAKFIAQGRVRGTNTDVRVTIGSYGAWTVDEARRKADEYRHQFEQGIDPREVAREQKATQVTLQTVLDAYVGRPGKLRASTAAEYRRHIEQVFASWRDKPIASITRDMVRDRHAEMMTGGLDGKRAAPASANAAMVTLRILFNFAMDEYRRGDGTSLITHNPVGALKHHWAKLGSRTERYVERGKVGAVWNTLHEARENPRSRDALAGIDLTIFLLLTGARRDEGAALTWDRVHLSDDPAECSWHLDQRKRGEPITLPLSSQAAALLRDRVARADKLAADTGTERSPYVFPSWSRAGRIMDARSAMETVSEVAGRHLSLHDLRRSFTNYAMRECRLEKFTTDLLTGHKPAQEDVTARNYLDLTNLGWLQPDVQKIGDWIEQQGRVAAAQASGANVVALRA